MAGLEDMMAGLFGGNTSPGVDEIRRRQRGPGSGGYDGIGGAAITPGALMPYYQGLPGYDFSGANFRDFQGGGRGLQSLLNEAAGPALRHFARQGGDFMPPGQDLREQPGGPNVAPGNIDNAQALYQPQGPGHIPGIPQGAAVGQAPGQVRPVPRTQGWRNLAPGYGAAAGAGYGSGDPTTFLGGAQVRSGAPAAASAGPPGRPGSYGPGGGDRGPSDVRNYGGPGGGGPTSQNPIATGGAPGPAGGGGGPGGGRGQGAGGGTVSGAAGGQGGKPGGGANAAPVAQPSVGGRPEGQGGRPSEDRRGGGGSFGGTSLNDVAGAGVGALSSAVGDVFGGGRRGGGGTFGTTQGSIGPGGRPSGRGGKGTAQAKGGKGGKGGGGNADGGPKGNQGMYAGETKAEKQARLAAKEQRQDARAAREAAQDARQAAARQAALRQQNAAAAAQEAQSPSTAATGQAPQPSQGGRPGGTAGKTKPKPRLNTGRRS